MLFGDSPTSTSKLYGAIDPKCDVPLVVEDAFGDAKFLCEQYYFGSPPLQIKIHNGKFAVKILLFNSLAVERSKINH